MIRRDVLLALVGAATAPFVVDPFGGTPARAAGVDINSILHDPEAPVGGNPNGDVTIVAFFDYNCPFCKKSEPDLKRIVETDGRIKLVYKDWPILTEASIHGARLALAAKYQNKYQQIHDALLAIPGHKIPATQMLEAAKATGIDSTKLLEDLKAHASQIDGLLQRNLAQADAMGLQGTPVFLIGPFLVAQALDLDGFKGAVAQARERQASK